MKKILSVLLMLTLCINIAKTQLDEIMPIQNNTNIEITAVEPAIYLIGQEYVLVKNGKRLGKDGNNYFGKLYGIGILVEKNLWFPTYLKTPWLFDNNYKEYENTHKAESSIITINAINDSIKSSFVLKKKKTDEDLTYLVMQENGVNLNSDANKDGILLVYHAPKDKIETKENITSSIIEYDDLNWSNGKCDIKKPFFGDRIILGGVLFSKHISIGKIEWKATTLMTKLPENDSWQLSKLNNSGN